MSKTDPWFPCVLVEQETDYSVICSTFHFFDDHFGDKGGGGYDVQRLAKRLVREHQIKGVRFDSEAGMFCAYSELKGPLRQLCLQLRKITGGPAKHRPKASATSKAKAISADKAERLLLKGFVLALDQKSQQTFLKHVPCPPLTKNQSELLKQVRSGTDAEKIRAIKKIDSEARTLVTQKDHYLSHPETTGMLLQCCDNNADNRAIVFEALNAVESICDRHFADRRAQPYFETALTDRSADMRRVGLLGLSALCVLTQRQIKPLLEDKSAKVRKTAELCRGWISRRAMKFPDWMFDTKILRDVRRELRGK